MDYFKTKAQLLFEAALKKYLDDHSVLNPQIKVDTPPEEEWGDYAFACFSLAKTLKKNPTLIASDLSAILKEMIPGTDFHKTSAVQAFCNLYIDPVKLAERVIHPQIKYDEISKKIVIEFSQPNTHKEFHIGHARNVCLGDSITRLKKAIGHEVIPVNYIGDEGTHVAKCLWKVDQNKEKMPKKDFVKWYGEQYVEAVKALEADPKQQEAVSKILIQIESKKGYFYDLWLKTRQDCLDDFNKIYAWLDVKFDKFYYESDMTHPSQKIVDDYIKKGLFLESNGAFGIDMKDFDLGYFMVRKSDGTSLYITKDLALAHIKSEEFKMDESIFVVGNEQILHFRQLFKALELMGFKNNVFYHLAYAHVKLASGKMSSRKGESFTFIQLIELVSEEVLEHLKKYEGIWDKSEIDNALQALTVGAIKYGMLSSDPMKEIVFDSKTWTSFDGNSGPYLMYSYSRCYSILEKSGLTLDNVKVDYSLLSDPLELSLMRQIYQFQNVVQNAAKQYKPSLLCHYLFDLCKSVNRFYAHVNILKSETEALKIARLMLLKSFNSHLKEGLSYLGIKTLNKM